jgi:hypothetical protein
MVNVPKFGLSYFTQANRLGDLARRSSLAILVMAHPSAPFLFCDLDRRHSLDLHFLGVLLSRGYRVAGVCGFTEHGIEVVEAGDRYADVMARARETFAVYVVERLNTGDSCTT